MFRPPGHGSMCGADQAGNPENYAVRVADNGPPPPLFTGHLPVDEDFLHFFFGLEAERADPVTHPQRPDGQRGCNRLPIERDPVVAFRQTTDPFPDGPGTLLPQKKPGTTGIAPLFRLLLSAPAISSRTIHPHDRFLHAQTIEGSSFHCIPGPTLTSLRRFPLLSTDFP